MATTVLPLLILLLLSLATLSFSFQFNVGGDKGWIKPPANDSNAYNNWAGQTRFQIGDTLYFKYMNDSVLVVNKAHYDACNANNAISKHTDGKTVIKLDHDGLFYFISGKMENCRAGQKLIIDVLADHFGIDATSPAPAPGINSTIPASAPSDGGGGVRESSMPKSAADKPYISSAVLSFVAVVYMLL